MMRIEAIVKSQDDLARLNGVIAGLVGQECWKLAFSYGDELYIEFGAKIPYAQPPMAGRLHGEWRLGARDSPWVLYRADGSEITSSKFKVEESRARFEEFVDLRVAEVAVSLPNLDLLIEYEDSTRLEVRSCRGYNEDSDDEDEDLRSIELACWDLIMPGGQILEAWEGQRWTIQPYPYEYD